MGVVGADVGDEFRDLSKLFDGHVFGVFRQRLHEATCSDDLGVGGAEIRWNHFAVFVVKPVWTDSTCPSKSHGVG